MEVKFIPSSLSTLFSLLKFCVSIFAPMFFSPSSKKGATFSPTLSSLSRIYKCKRRGRDQEWRGKKKEKKKEANKGRDT